MTLQNLNCLRNCTPLVHVVNYVVQQCSYFDLMVMLKIDI